ncbi:MAG: hypothetical protein ACI8QS_000951 [Planctomycetota bacterium]|jgi:hypothetical protein
MTIHRDNDFLVDTDLAGRLSVGIESDRIEECVAEFAARGASGVFGAPCFGFTGDDLDFLHLIPDLEKIWFWDVSLRDVAGVYALTNLRHFGVHPRRPAIDFNRLRSLEEMVWHYTAKDTNLDALKALQLLHVWHFNPKQRSFEGLALPSHLTELQINWANPRSLEGLPELPALKRLEIHRCRNLESISELARIAPNVEHLVVSACGRVSDGPEVVKHLPHLRHAFVCDQVLVCA